MKFGIKASGPFNIREVTIPYSDKWRGGIRLLKYQKEIIEEEEKLLLVNAPTGSGKTLASALVAYDRRGVSAFIYPTNSLALDQAKSMAKDLSKCGISAEILDPRRPEVRSPEVILVQISSLSLDQLASSLGVRTHGEALQKLRTQLLPAESVLFLLTNPDFLFSLIKGIPRLKRHRILWRDFVQGLRTLVIDEFHLYYGFSLANILSSLYLLWKSLSKVIMSSATPGSTKQLLNWWDGKLITTKPIEKEEGRKIRHRTSLYIASLADGPLWSEEHANYLIAPVKNFLSWARERAPKTSIKVLILVNSIIFAERLYKKLKEKVDAEVSRIHGFIPEDARNISSEVLVGTRAIDIGIDFDTATVIFEALNAPDFVQRLGRGSRRRPGIALALIPGSYSQELRKRLQNYENSIPYGSLISEVNSVLPSIKTYLEKISGFIGALSLFTLIHSVNASLSLNHRKTREVEEQLRKRELVEESLEVFRELLREPPSWLRSQNPDELLKKIKKKLGLFFTSTKLVSLARSGMRGIPLPIRAHFVEFNAWNEIDVTDLAKASFLVKEDNKGIYVEIIGPSRGRPLRIIMHNYPRGASILNNFDLECDERLKKSLQPLLQGVLFKFVSGKPKDWRFSTFDAIVGQGYSGKIVIGPDSFIEGEE